MAETIYFGGNVITMNDAQPAAQAVAVRAGKILAVGSRSEIKKFKGADTQQVDLRGRTLLPGFIDAHGHVSSVGLQAMSANLLPPPDGANSSIADLQTTLREFMRTSPMPEQLDLVMGFGYDDSQLKERRHPTRAELDAVSKDRPVIVIHQSGHLGAVNSKALALAGITAASTDPEGGVIRRMPGSREPNGVLEELSFFTVLTKLFLMDSPEQAIAMLDAGQALYLRYGYTTIQDGRVTPGPAKLAIAAAENGLFKVDVVAYPDALDPGSAALLTAPWYHDTSQPPSYRQHFRFGGIKLTLDGSPQGKTAWLGKPYFVPPAGLAADYTGYGVVDDATVLDVFTQSLRNRWQVLVHANGDRAIDQMLDAMAKAETAVPGVDVRPVLIHGQTLREDQVDRVKTLRIFPSLFPMHTFYWGDWHRESVLGPERAENISPTGWLMQRGMMFTSHHDAPVAFPDSMRVLSATVNRTTRSGHVLGPQHRVEPAVALKALTLWAAYQHFEEKTKGSIEVGKLADFVILSDNPLTIDRAKLADLKVMETIKEGTTVFKAP
jgi:predicted amidohydrolase YtcJ